MGTPDGMEFKRHPDIDPVPRFQPEGTVACKSPEATRLIPILCRAEITGNHKQSACNTEF